MERQSINPWIWQDHFGFVQANALRGPQRWLVCAGQAAVDQAGRPLSPGDLRAQIRQALDNLETVLGQGGFTLADVVRLTPYTTDVDGFLAAWDELSGRLSQAVSLILWSGLFRTFWGAARSHHQMLCPASLATAA
jgi:enamine deaminase RidA (YjgF/YER057c/UK114 family)